MKFVKSLLAGRKVGANVRLPRERGSPAIVHAARRGRADIVKLLLDAGARIDAASGVRTTACHAAVERGDRDVLELLIARGANLTLEDGDQMTALFVSLYHSHDDCSLMLIAAGSPVDVDSEEQSAYLCRLAATSTDAIQTLINRGIAIRDLHDCCKYTPLHFVAGFGWFTRLCLAGVRAVVNMLVNVCGVDLEDQLSGETCVHFAARYGRDDALRCFVEAGANVDAVDKDGRTALHFVCDSERAIVLLAAGADVHMLNSRGDTPLHSLFSIERNDDLPILHALLADGADLDAPSASGVTVRQLLGGASWRIDPAEVESARSHIASLRLDFVRRRALQVCIGLQSLQLDALQMCEILQQACKPMAHSIAFHQWWAIATTVKHFK